MRDPFGHRLVRPVLASCLANIAKDRTMWPALVMAVLIDGHDGIKGVFS